MATPSKPLELIPRPETIRSTGRQSKAAGPLGMLCRANGCTLTELSAASGVSKSVLQRIDRGHVRNVRFEVILRVAWAAGVSAADLCPILAARPGPAHGLFAVRSAQRKHIARVVRRIREDADARERIRERNERAQREEAT